MSLVRVVCIGGKLDGRAYDINQNVLDSGGVTIPDLIPLFHPGDWEITNSLEPIHTSVWACHYIASSLHFPGPWGTTNKVQYLHSPDIDALDAILRLLNHYAKKEQKDDAQQS